MQNETGRRLTRSKFLSNSYYVVFPRVLQVPPQCITFSLKNVIPFLKSSVVPQANTTFPCFLNKTGYWFITFPVWQQINMPGSSLSDDPKIAEQLFSWGKWTPGLPVWELWVIPSSQPFFCSQAEKAGLVTTHITFPALPFPWALTYFLAFGKITPSGFNCN